MLPHTQKFVFFFPLKRHTQPALHIIWILSTAPTGRSNSCEIKMMDSVCPVCVSLTCNLIKAMVDAEAVFLLRCGPQQKLQL